MGATGFAIGLERLMMIIDQDKKEQIPGVFVSLMDKALMDYGFDLVNQLRENGIISEWDPTGKSFRSQMRKADRQNWKYVIVVGEDEVKTSELAFKNMESGKQIKLKLEEIVEKLKTEGKND